MSVAGVRVVEFGTYCCCCCSCQLRCYTWTTTNAARLRSAVVLHACSAIDSWLSKTSICAAAAGLYRMPGRCAARRGRQDRPGSRSRGQRTDVTAEECLHRDSTFFDADNRATSFALFAAMQPCSSGVDVPCKQNSLSEQPSTTTLLIQVRQHS